ncbi:hypothetical protein HELRODRAFT_93262 [Helobdella robusta]|uniref:Peptidyl-prolyl cis-trans isomerase n=1 Tax=Helobdella robusta TaxID=6412 RepID=T1G8U6_HELRO|nr:hypothetical protein HELRODRAFT_93262 [Helobdella robusta]ESO12422.1 hypothetical protein HELRODRAFT_93262 [Helobdella robusta]
MNKLCLILLVAINISSAFAGPGTVGLKALFDIRIGDEYVGRIVFGLMNETCPLTVANFAALCDGKLPGGVGYMNSTFHRVIKNFMIQGGDVVNGNGYGVKSIYNNGSNFNDENFILKNYIGWLGMANAGPNTNGCQIYINTVLTPWLDNKHVVFGKVLSGWDVVKQIENNPIDSNDRPIKPVVISYSATFPVDKPFDVPLASI